MFAENAEFEELSIVNGASIDIEFKEGSNKYIVSNSGDRKDKNIIPISGEFLLNTVPTTKHARKKKFLSRTEMPIVEVTKNRSQLALTGLDGPAPPKIVKSFPDDKPKKLKKRKSRKFDEPEEAPMKKSKGMEIVEEEEESPKKAKKSKKSKMKKEVKETEEPEIEVKTKKSKKMKKEVEEIDEEPQTKVKTKKSKKNKKEKN